MSGYGLSPLSGHGLLALNNFSGDSLLLLSGYGLWPLTFFSGSGLSPLTGCGLAAEGLLNHLVEPLPQNLEVVGVLPPAPHDGDNPKAQELSSGCLLLPFGQPRLLSHLRLTLIHPAVSVCAFVCEEEELAEEQADGCAANDSRRSGE